MVRESLIRHNLGNEVELQRPSGVVSTTSPTPLPTRTGHYVGHDVGHVLEAAEHDPARLEDPARRPPPGTATPPPRGPTASNE
ncbi:MULTISPECIES: hypothetical protein [unclassified Frankia]|uniref:hypothetical protein n=1 Tax=unclassified Frankia TaxID=2632575 RepID=UPI002AD34C1A|nr:MULTISPECIES: hypothetical protein [unclassified Frankia]